MHGTILKPIIATFLENTNLKNKKRNLWDPMESMGSMEAMEAAIGHQGHCQWHYTSFLAKSLIFIWVYRVILIFLLLVLIKIHLLLRRSMD